ncbi:hypothetical protein V6N12_002236 [Hibiscus sabdariffa]|uniref:Uncharacterized protein n=1 Tax=Hibiscus sabdariffa TaxID=183260 RepID=A0ABR1ZM05_9ROSI
MEPRRSRNQLRSLTTSIADLRAIPSDQDCVEICGLPTQNVSVHHCDSPSTSLNVGGSDEMNNGEVLVRGCRCLVRGLVQ